VRPGRTLPIALLLLIGFAGVASGPAAGTGASPAVGWLTLIQTNDIHGGYALREATWRDDRAAVGGFLALSGLVETVRAEHPVLLVDAGDLMTGNPLTAIEHDGVIGGCAMAFMNAVGYDAMALGNHEFDNGRDAAEALIAMARFPVLAANLHEEVGEASGAGGTRPFLPGHVILERGGLRVGVIGLILDDLAAVVAAEPIRGLEIESTVDAARREVAAIDPGTDLIIVVLHAGLAAAERLASAVDGIDVVVAGHDHRRVEEPRQVNGALIIESGSQLANAGRLDMRVEGDRIVEHRYELVLLEADRVTRARPAVRTVHADCDAAVQAEYGQVIATLARPLERVSDGESNVGNWVTDAMRAAAGTDFAVTNSSGLRADLEAGPLTRLDIHRLLPFRNVLSTFRCTGHDLVTLAQRNAAAALGHGSFLQLSGIRFTYDNQGEVHDVMVGDVPVDLDRTYTGATNDYLLFSQAERYLGFVPGGRERTARLISDLLSATAAGEGRIDARIDGRVRRLAREAATGEPVTANE
jgi:2',3'-cyclic-nucleotide 2'-phosphodiesterase (5'-nucleotidase family)